ncbi:MAG: hypothetical protein HC897_11135 [Thermoanaerobaculia bacterium]|nr:hypothetical protein [Thermoanaerobaculia bacterium]
MLVKIATVFVLVLVLTLTPALASPDGFEVPGPCLIVFEASAAHHLVVPVDLNDTLHPVVLETSPSHLVIAVEEPGTLWLDTSDDTEIVATLTPVRITERKLLLAGGGRAIARSYFPLVAETKEEDHDIDPAPKHGDLAPVWTDPWALASAAIAELGPGWYFVVRDGEAAFEILIEAR